MPKKKKKPQSTLGKIWYFIWHDDSFLSWIVNLILAFVIIKFIVFPTLGGLLGTDLPVVAVVSESMEHGATAIYSKQGSGECKFANYKLCTYYGPDKVEKNFDNYWQYCGDWYEEKGISREQFETFPLKNGFSKGDIIVLTGKEPEDIQIGDTIVFQAKKAYPIIHRVVQIDGEIFQTKGDHNPSQINDGLLNEYNIHQDQILGVAKARVPYLGWVKIGLVELLQGKSKCDKLA